MSPVGTKRTNRTDLMMSVIGPETESGWHTVRGTRMTRSDKSGPQYHLGTETETRRYKQRARLLRYPWSSQRIDQSCRATYL